MPDIVLVHGMFMNAESWAGWVDRFTARGFRVHAPSWPGHEGAPADLRRDPPEILRALTLGEVIQAHRDLIAGLPEKPIVIGHSMGGLVAQRLLNEDRAAAAVAIDSAPPRKIFTTRWSFLKANLPVVNPFKGSAPFLFTPDQFRYAFCNTAAPEQAQAMYEALVVPESRQVARGAAGPDGAIDFARAHAPLLLISGERDNIVPYDLNEKNHRAYTHAGSVCAYRMFAGRDHALCGAAGWEEIADFVEGWLREHALPA